MKSVFALFLCNNNIQTTQKAKKKMKTILASLVLFTIILPSLAQASCLVANSDNSPTQPKDDALYRLLSEMPGCPQRAQDLKAQFKSDGAQVEPAMVGNRGFHNPEGGSFSFFETVSGHLDKSGTEVAKGDLFFGHFTGATDDHQLILDQEPSKGKLMVELIAWDKKKGMYNFYELIGQGGKAQWFYRGDSADILHDNANIDRDVPHGQDKFGKRLRCSGCHASGGPIMKEMASPHNDWWTEARPLPFGSNCPSSEINKWLEGVVDADQLAQNVKTGIQKLEDSPSYRKARAAMSLQEKLRPLFCENEINLESSPKPSDSAGAVQIPGGFFMNPLLGSPKVFVPQATYQKYLRDNSMAFPETNRSDSDHPWLTPVKGYSDLLAIQTLMNESLIDKAFMTSVLSIDIERPLLSKSRCSLLKLVPSEGPHWREQFMQNLKTSSLPAARELATNLASPANEQALVDRAKALATKLEKTATTNQTFKNLIEVRRAVFKSEISQNPRGQILEPGFRVIFPEPGKNVAHRRMDNRDSDRTPEHRTCPQAQNVKSGDPQQGLR
jgi:hypothetical protein